MSHSSSGSESPRDIVSRMPRPAMQADEVELVRLINLAYRVEDFFIDGNRVTIADVRSRMIAGNAGFLVIDALDGEGLAATVHYSLEGTTAYFSLLSVAPKFQNQGLARSMVAAVELLARESGCATLELEYVDLREELPRLYGKMGFAVTGERPFPNPGKLRRPAIMVRMSKSL